MNTPIFIHGILKRSGTNLLNGMILLDPNCKQPTSSVRENWFLPNSAPVFDYADRLFKTWSSPIWGGEPFSRSNFYESIGNGLIEYLKHPSLHDGAVRLVTKTPSVTNLNRADILFPNVKHVIMVRDPMDIAASAYNSWKIPVEQTLREWYAACIEIDRFCRQTRTDYILLRYEDLLNEPLIVFQDVIDRLGLEMPDDVWDRIRDMPLYGSSDDGANWTVTPKSDVFRSTNKWKQLPADQLKQAAASYDGRFATYFGYSEEPGGLMGALPATQERKLMGTSLPAIDNTGKDTTRRKDLKQGVRLIKRAILG
ncbi:MAG: sulfotransferase [Flavobacteriales bacterium]|nr:sulfotransferase [Flavobacteriales bacterium]